MTKTLQAAILFAAGFGTRMGALTKDRPKPLIGVAGRPLIDQALDLIEPMRLQRVVANVHYHADQLARHLIPKGVLLSHEAPKILETGDGLRAALPLLGSSPVFTLNSDAIWTGSNPLQMLRDHWDPDQMDALLTCVPENQALGHTGPGDFIRDESGRITRGAGLVYGGAQILKTDGLNDFTEDAFSLNILWERMLQNRHLFALSYPGRWCDVGRPEGIALAEGLIADV